jgi:hypothetical protein
MYWKHPPPSPARGISANVIWGKNIKGGREKRRKCEGEKGRKDKGKLKFKNVKSMKNGQK